MSVKKIAELQARLDFADSARADDIIMYQRLIMEARLKFSAAAERERGLRVALENWVSSWGKGYEMERLSYEEAMIALSPEQGKEK